MSFGLFDSLGFMLVKIEEFEQFWACLNVDSTLALPCCMKHEDWALLICIEPRVLTVGPRKLSLMDVYEGC